MSLMTTSFLHGEVAFYGGGNGDLVMAGNCIHWPSQGSIHTESGIHTMAVQNILYQEEKNIACRITELL